MSGFFASGPHMPFVWGAYAVTFVVLAALVLLSVADRRRARRELAERGLERRR
jgi:heme exporter protein CcmD